MLSLITPSWLLGDRYFSTLFNNYYIGAKTFSDYEQQVLTHQIDG